MICMGSKLTAPSIVFLEWKHYICEVSEREGIFFTYKKCSKNCLR